MTSADEVEVQFSTRAVAEQGMAKGVPPGSTLVSWYSALKSAPAVINSQDTVMEVPPESTAVPSKSTIYHPVYTTPATTAAPEVSEPDTSTVHISTSSGAEPRSLAETDVVPSSVAPISNIEAVSANHEEDGELDGGWGAGGGFDD